MHPHSCACAGARRLTFLPRVALVAVLAAAVAAPATARAAAEVTRTSFCNPFIDADQVAGRYCIESTAVTNPVYAGQSGNYSSIGNVRSTFDLEIYPGYEVAGCSQHSVARETSHVLYADATLQQSTLVARGADTFDCGDGGTPITCEYQEIFVFADGAYRASRFDETCTQA